MADFPLADELRRDIANEVKEIRRRAREQGEALLAETEQQLRRREEDAALRLEEECDLRLKRGSSRLDLDARNSLLRIREQDLDEVFVAVRLKLAAMKSADPERYSRLFRSVFARCQAVLPPAELRLRIDAELSPLYPWVSLQEGLEVIAEPRLEGLILETRDGRLHCDGRLPFLLQSLRRERAAELERILFGEDL